MTKPDVRFKRQITALTNEEYSALEDAAERDMRGEADQARYLIVEGLRRRNLLHDYSGASTTTEKHDNPSIPTAVKVVGVPGKEMF